MSKKPSPSIIALIFEAFERENIPYLVLRNYETLPEKPLPGSDIDIFIDPRAKRVYPSILKQVFRENKTFILQEIHHYNCSSYLIYQPPFSLITWIDIISMITTKEGLIWINNDLLLKTRILHSKGFYIPSSGMEAAILLLKDILEGKAVKGRYRSKIRGLVKQGRKTFLQALSPYFGKGITNQMFQISLNERWEEAFKNKRRWWLTLLLNSFRRQPLRQLFLSLNFLWSHFKEQFYLRRGMSIAIIGPDGVGKTTICQNLQKRMNPLFKKIYYYHGHFGFFPELSKIYNFLIPAKSKSLVISDKNLNKFQAFFHLVYYGLEFFLSWPWIFWAKIRGYLFIFDRYFYDFAATAIHRKLPFRLFFVISKIIPRPDIVFVVKTQPDVIYKRKPELSIDEIKGQLAVFQDFRLSKLALHNVIIDSSQPLEIIMDKIEEEFLKFYSKYS